MGSESAGSAKGCRNAGTRSSSIERPGGSWFRDRSWSRAVQAVSELPGNELPLSLALRLVRTWDDEATAVSPEYLAQCFKAARTATGTIVDFGAGVTTIVMAMALP